MLLTLLCESVCVCPSLWETSAGLATMVHGPWVSTRVCFARPCSACSSNVEEKIDKINRARVSSVAILAHCASGRRSGTGPWVRRRRLEGALGGGAGRGGASEHRAPRSASVLPRYDETAE